jgi:hypothetical protein
VVVVLDVLDVVVVEGCVVVLELVVVVVLDVASVTVIEQVTPSTGCPR